MQLTGVNAVCITKASRWPYEISKLRGSCRRRRLAETAARRDQSSGPKHTARSVHTAQLGDLQIRMSACAQSSR